MHETSTTPQMSPNRPHPVASMTWRPSSGRFDEPFFDLANESPGSFFWPKHRGVEISEKWRNDERNLPGKPEEFVFPSFEATKIAMRQLVLGVSSWWEIFNSNDCFAGRSICTSLLIFIEINWGQFFVCQWNICQDFSKNLGWFSTIQPTEMSKYGKGAQLFTKFTDLRLQFTQIDGKKSGWTRFTLQNPEFTYSKHKLTIATFRALGPTS